MKYPTTNDLLIARHLMIIQHNDKAKERFLENANKMQVYDQEVLNDHLDLFDKPIRVSLGFIVNRAKTMNCAASLKFAQERLKEMENYASS